MLFQPFFDLFQAHLCELGSEPFSPAQEIPFVFFDGETLAGVESAGTRWFDSVNRGYQFLFLHAEIPKNRENVFPTKGLLFDAIANQALSCGLVQS